MLVADSNPSAGHLSDNVLLDKLLVAHGVSTSVYYKRASLHGTPGMGVVWTHYLACTFGGTRSPSVMEVKQTDRMTANIGCKLSAQASLMFQDDGTFCIRVAFPVVDWTDGHPLHLHSKSAAVDALHHPVVNSHAAALLEDMVSL